MADKEATPALTDAEYVTRRDALIQGDTGVLPDGKTCAETRSEYEALATAPPPGATVETRPSA